MQFSLLFRITYGNVYLVSNYALFDSLNPAHETNLG
jgi:hypothetical protein